MFVRDEFIRLDEEAHRYFDINGKEYTSMSKVLSITKVPFDKEGRSNRMSGGNAQKKKELLASWQYETDKSINHGNRIHKALEDHINAREVFDPELLALAKSFSSELKMYEKVYPEGLLYSKEYGIAGTSDLILQRQKKGGLTDFFDYKTNLNRGIYFDSINRKDGTTKHYNKFLLPPVDHLEECNYNTYALQLSGYAYTAELTFGIRPGKLFIVWIYFEQNGIGYDYRMIPVPYMKYEIKAIFETFKNLKKL